MTMEPECEHGECFGGKCIYLSATPGQPAPATPPLRMTEEPVAWIRWRSDGGYEGPLMHSQIEEVRKTSGAWTPLFAAPTDAQLTDAYAEGRKDEREEWEQKQ